MSVEDHGVGIDPQVMERIFERFFHTDEVRGHLFRGIGLGLSIARQVIEGHHGTITVSSVPGQGTRVLISLPEGGADSGQGQ